MRKVVVTGIGIVSCIGNDQKTVVSSLRQAKSGVSFAPEYAERGFRSCVHGMIDIDIEALVARKWRRFMGDGSAYAAIAMRAAIEDAGLEEQQIVDPRIGIITGSGGPSTANLVASFKSLEKHKSTRRIGPFMVPRTMSSTSSAVLATAFGIRGVNYTISSACSTSAHCIGNAAELIQWGKQDAVFAGGCEEIHWSMSCLFDAMGALSSKYNDSPSKASRAFDAERDGFVIAGGSAILLLEEAERAQKRGAKIYAELTGYGATSDGLDMVQPSGEGARRCMQQALKTTRSKVEYINTHGTSTPIGDVVECGVIDQLFQEKQPNDLPFISSTKSLTGHSLGAAGAQEATYTLLMMQNDFMCESANIEKLDEKIADKPIAKAILRERRDAPFSCAMSNSFGFGGTNATLIFEKV